MKEAARINAHLRITTRLQVEVWDPITWVVYLWISAGEAPTLIILEVKMESYTTGGK